MITKDVSNALEKLKGKNVSMIDTSEDLGKITGYTSDSFYKFAKTADTSGDLVSQYKQHLQETVQSTSKFSAFTSKAGSALKSFAAGALNIAGGIGISLAISAAIGLIDDLIHRQERIIEKGEEAKKSISDTFNDNLLSTFYIIFPNLYFKASTHDHSYHTYLQFYYYPRTPW